MRRPQVSLLQIFTRSPLILSSVWEGGGGGLLKTQFVFTPWPHIWHKWRKSVCTSRNLLCFSDWATSQPRAAWKEGTCATAGYDARAAVKPVWPKSSGCTLVPECLIIDTVNLPERRWRRSWSSAVELSTSVSIVCVTEQRFKNVTKVKVLLSSPL